MRIIKLLAHFHKILFMMPIFEKVHLLSDTSSKHSEPFSIQDNLINI